MSVAPTTRALADALLARVAARTATVGVVGLGYVGLPLVLAFARAGFRAMGFDIDPRKVEHLRAGTSYLRHIPAEGIGELVANGRLVPTADFGQTGVV